jgi:acetyl-CoA C-acetyltransferase
MVANPQVNQASALLMTTLATARQLGVPEEKLVHVWGGTGATELRDFASRDRFDRSMAMESVLRAAWASLDDANADARRVDLYSCFPCVPKMARRVLGLGVDEAAGVTGGLPFFGAPLSNYMGHATNAMVPACCTDRAST